VNILGVLILYHFLSFQSGLGSHFLVSFLACFFLLEIGFSWKLFIHSFHFHSIILKIQKCFFFTFCPEHLHFWMQYISFDMLENISLHGNYKDCFRITTFIRIPYI
jgi:hypothetical protein